MTALVGTFNVDVNVVDSTLESLDSRLRLALVVGMYVAGCALNVDRLHFGAKTDSLDKVNCGDDRALNTPFFLKGGKSGLFAGAPEPN